MNKSGQIVPHTWGDLKKESCDYYHRASRKALLTPASVVKEVANDGIPDNTKHLHRKRVGLPRFRLNRRCDPTRNINFSCAHGVQSHHLNDDSKCPQITAILNGQMRCTSTDSCT